MYSFIGLLPEVRKNFVVIILKVDIFDLKFGLHLGLGWGALGFC